MNKLENWNKQELKFRKEANEEGISEIVESITNRINENRDNSNQIIIQKTELLTAIKGYLADYPDDEIIRR